MRRLCGFYIYRDSEIQSARHISNSICVLNIHSRINRFFSFQTVFIDIVNRDSSEEQCDTDLLSISLGMMIKNYSQTLSPSEKEETLSP